MPAVWLAFCCRFFRFGGCAARVSGRLCCCRRAHQKARSDPGPARGGAVVSGPTGRLPARLARCSVAVCLKRVLTHGRSSCAVPVMVRGSKAGGVYRRQALGLGGQVPSRPSQARDAGLPGPSSAAASSGGPTIVCQLCGCLGHEALACDLWLTATEDPLVCQLCGEANHIATTCHRLTASVEQLLYDSSRRDALIAEVEMSKDPEREDAPVCWRLEAIPYAPLPRAAPKGRAGPRPPAYPPTQQRRDAGDDATSDPGPSPSPRPKRKRAHRGRRH